MIGNRELKQYAITLCEVVLCLLLEEFYQNAHELQRRAFNNHLLSSDATQNEQLSISLLLEPHVVQLNRA
jgi:hypothetical protein